jgi:hypothetical protein
VIFATADQTVANNATLTASTYLTFTPANNTKYAFRLLAYIDTTAAGDYKYSLTCPASPTLVRIMRHTSVAGGGPASLAVDSAAIGSTARLATPAGAAIVIMEGILQNAAGGGTLTFNFAQNTQTNDAGATLYAGSYLEYRVVA